MTDRDPQTGHGTFKPEPPHSRPAERSLGMTAVITRLEAATEGSRELDNLIEAAIDLPKPSNPDDLPDYPPHFTTSLDAALTLVPEASPPLHWKLERFPHGTHTAHVSDKYPVGNHYCGQNKHSPALALCIAALKARLVDARKSGVASRSARPLPNADDEKARE